VAGPSWSLARCSPGSAELVQLPADDHEPDEQEQPVTGVRDAEQRAERFADDGKGLIAVTGRAATTTGVAVAVIATAVLLGRRMSRWGASEEELSRSLPGDDEVQDPQVASTRAISIRAPARLVWPWLVQMGWRRAGWYSYDVIDNDRIPSADHIIGTLQGLQPGDFVPEGPGVGWTVAAVEPDRMLLLTTHAPMTGVAWVRWRDSSWLFLIEERGAEHSRLIERARTTLTTNPDTIAGKLLSTRLGGSALAVGDFVMAHRHMHGIRRRAEAQWRDRPEPPRHDRGGPTTNPVS